MSATARWCGSSSRPWCAGSARCAICSRVCSNADFRPASPRVESALLIGAAQILFLDVPDHAAVDLSVRLVQEDRHARHYSALVNAVLRRVARDGAARLAAIDPVVLDTPEWLMRRWQAHYGDATARAIAAANAQEPALDLTVKDEPRQWAARLDGRVLPTGSVRVAAHGPVTRLAGFGDGAWWVQDAAAALPVRLLGDVRGKIGRRPLRRAGRQDRAARARAARASPRSIARSRGSIACAKTWRGSASTPNIVRADATQWQGGPFDAVLVDAPCLATGTIRRHPDIPWLKSEAELVKLTALQARLLDRAAELVRPGGTLVYCTCSLEPEEGEAGGRRAAGAPSRSPAPADRRR